MKKFDNIKYKIVRGAINKKVASAFTDYIFLKQHVAARVLKDGYAPSYQTVWGVWNDTQAPRTYSCYSDIFAETLLLQLHPVIEKEIKKKLYPTYSYVRIYKKGDVLKKHIDRPSCEISATLNIHNSKWPIYFKDKNKTIKINLKEGDLAIYKGCELQHWRDELESDFCVQVFLHFTTNNSKELLFDGRDFLGLPNEYKDRDIVRQMLEQNKILKNE